MVVGIPGNSEGVGRAGRLLNLTGIVCFELESM